MDCTYSFFVVLGGIAAMNTKKPFEYSYRMMIATALASGVLSIVFLLLEGLELISYFLAVAGIAILIGGGKLAAKTEPNLPEKSFKTAFEWLLLIMMAAMVFLMTSNGFRVFIKANDFLSTHWPGLVLSVMCIVLGLSGLRKTNQAQNV
jgi:hypothetical protein